MKTKHTLYNSVASLAYYLVTILLGILNRKAVIVILGIEYQGINGLFSNVLSMLSIAELGIGTAIIFHLYKPLHDRDITAVQSLMQFYKKCYIAIAGVIGIIGLCIIPALNYIVTENTLPYSLTELYIWFLLDAVVSYLFTYKRSVLIADQKNYVVLGCDLLYQCSVKLGQIAVLVLTHNFICYLFVMVLTRILENLFLNYLSGRMYPFLKEKNIKKLSPEILQDIKKKVKGTVFHKIGSFVVLGTDNILISKFLGLAMVGIYSNYFLIINSIKNICSQIVSAATASVGHMLTEGDDSKNYEIFMEIQLLNIGLINCAACGIYCTATPLVAAIFGNEYVLSEETLFVLSFNFYLYGMRNVFAIFKETAGILYEDRWVPLLESCINIVASLIFLHFFGLAGIFMGTITSSLLLFFYTYPVLVYKKVLKRSYKEYYQEFIRLVGLSIGSLGITKITARIFQWDHIQIQIMSNIAVCLAVPFVLYILVYARCHYKESRRLIERVRMTFKKSM